MIKSFKNKGLQELLEKGKTAKIAPALVDKCTIILTLLHDADKLEDLNLPFLHLHKLQGKPVRHSLRVNKNFRVTFEWDEGAVKVDFEDYH